MTPRECPKCGHEWNFKSGSTRCILCGAEHPFPKPARIEYHGDRTVAPDAGKVGIDMKTKQTKIIEPADFKAKGYHSKSEMRRVEVTSNKESHIQGFGSAPQAANDFPDKCVACGTPVRVDGNVTKSYVSAYDAVVEKRDRFALTIFDLEKQVAQLQQTPLAEKLFKVGRELAEAKELEETMREMYEYGSSFPVQASYKDQIEKLQAENSSLRTGIDVLAAEKSAAREEILELKGDNACAFVDRDDALARVKELEYAVNAVKVANEQINQKCGIKKERIAELTAALELIAKKDIDHKPVRECRNDAFEFQGIAQMALKESK